MSLYLIWLIICGIAVNAWFVWNIGKGVGYAVAMFVCAASYSRWTYLAGKTHGFRETKFPTWMYIPQTVLRRWMYFLGNGSTGVSASSSAGVWKGVGNWTVFPASLEEESSHDSN